MDISKAINNFRHELGKHSPEILTGLGIAGMVTTCVISVKATPKALIVLEEIHKHNEENDISDKKEIGKQIVTKVCPLYLPAAVTGVVSIACIIGGQSVNLRRNAALATAYSLSESAFKDYRQKVVESIGEKKEKTIRDEVAKENRANHPIRNNEVIITDRGDTLFFDPISSRYFRNSIDNMKKIQNNLAYRMSYGMEPYISLNDIYYEVGLPSIEMGEDLGFTTRDGLVEFDLGTADVAENGEPCLILSYIVAPKYGYGDLH